MLITLKKNLTKALLKLLHLLEPSYFVRPVIHTNPPNALLHLVNTVDKNLGSPWEKNTVPSDPIELIMFRAGAKGYRDQLLRELHASSPASVPKGHRL